MTTLYSKNNCPQCKQTKNLLNKHNIPYTERNIDTDLQALNYVVSIGIKSAPYVESDRGNWTGFRPDRIRELKG